MRVVFCVTDEFNPPIMPANATGFLESAITSIDGSNSMDSLSKVNNVSLLFAGPLTSATRCRVAIEKAAHRATARDTGMLETVGW